MTGISHKQARKYLYAAADGLLRANQRVLLDAHLNECASCHTEAGELNQLEAQLKNSLQSRWDGQDNSSKNIRININSQSRRIVMKNRINIGLRTFAGLTALFALGILFSSVVKQLKSHSPGNNNPASTSSNNLIAFTSLKSGNSEIYTMHVDGSNVTNLTNDPANDHGIVWSPDGKQIAFMSERTGNADIFVMNPDGSNVVQLTDNPGYDELSSWSPDGSKIAYFSSSKNEITSYGQIIVMNRDGSDKVDLTKDIGSSSSFGLSWSPDGQKIVFSKNGTTAYITDIDGTHQHILTTDMELGKIQWQDSQHFLGMGERILDGQPERSLYQFNTDANAPLKLFSSEHPIVAIFEKTYVVENQVALSWYSLDDPAAPLSSWNIDRICKTQGDPYMQDTTHVTSPDKKYSFVSVYCYEHTASFFLMNEDGTEIRQLGETITNTDSIPGGISWSPDGKYVAVPIESSQSAGSDIYLFDIKKMLYDPSTKPIKLTSDGASNYEVSWQPPVSEDIVNEKPTHVSQQYPIIGTGKLNGEWIAFIGEKVIPFLDTNSLTFTSDVYLIHPDGTGLTNITNTTNEPYFDLEWSPDGEQLTFLKTRANNKIEILRGNQDGWAVLVDTNIDYSDTYLPDEYRWSPDSKHIAYIDNPNGDYDIFTINEDGSNKHQLTNDPGRDTGMVWSPDGSRIVYQNTNGNSLSIRVMNADGSNPLEIAHGTGTLNLQWSQDGQSIHATTGFEAGALECEACSPNAAVYRILMDGSSIQQIYHMETPFTKDEKENTAIFDLYETPKNTVYFRLQEYFSFNVWGSWVRTDGKSTEIIGKIDPHQTCKEKTRGNLLEEYISPNRQFSIISDFCAGGFDLYLADRNPPSLEKQVTHLLRLPLSTRAGGSEEGNGLPIFWSPDGRWIMYQGNSLYHGSAIYILDIEKTLQDPTTLPTPITEAGAADGFDNGQLLWFREFEWQPQP